MQEMLGKIVVNAAHEMLRKLPIYVECTGLRPTPFHFVGQAKNQLQWPQLIENHRVTASTKRSHLAGSYSL
jgi:hypothetical protein